MITLWVYTSVLSEKSEAQMVINDLSDRVEAVLTWIAYAPSRAADELRLLFQARTSSRHFLLSHEAKIGKCKKIDIQC